MRRLVCGPGCDSPPSPTDGSNFTFSGTYTVVGGTGEFAGATGSGTEIGARQDGPIVSDLSGTLELDEG